MRAYERDPAAIEAWKRDTYPSMRRGPNALALRFISGNLAFVPMRCNAETCPAARD